MQLEIPKFRWLAQDEDGNVHTSLKKLYPDDQWQEWYRRTGDGDSFILVARGKQNPNWRETKINLETDQYDYSDGILRRVEG